MKFADYHWTDWMNPVLVRETRQGVREKLFVSGLSILLAGLGFFVIYQCLVAQKELQNTTYYFRSLICYSFIVVLPVRAFFSCNIANEVKQQTFEALILTRLDTRRILLGKWISQISQSLLVVFILLPIIFMQYWLGGDEVFTNIIDLLISFTIGTMFTSLAMALSSIHFVILRYLALLPAGLMAYTFSDALSRSYTSVSINDSILETFLLALIWTYVLCEMVSPYIAISDAAPFRRRIIPLGFYGLVLLFL